MFWDIVIILFVANILLWPQWKCPASFPDLITSDYEPSRYDDPNGVHKMFHTGLYIHICDAAGAPHHKAANNRPITTRFRQPVTTPQVLGSKRNRFLALLWTAYTFFCEKDIRTGSRIEFQGKRNGYYT